MDSPRSPGRRTNPGTQTTISPPGASTRFISARDSQNFASCSWTAHDITRSKKPFLNMCMSFADPTTCWMPVSLGWSTMLMHQRSALPIRLERSSDLSFT